MKNPTVQVFATIIGGFIVVFVAFIYMRGSNAFALLSRRQEVQESVEATAIRSSKNEYKKAKDSNIDFSLSPCISEDMGNGYALDIVHDPRTVEDETNTCTQKNNPQEIKLVEMLPDGTIKNIVN